MASAIIIIAILLTVIFRTQTKFLKSVIAFIAIPEILSWIWLAYILFFYGQNILIFYVVFGAISLHIILNISYGIVHKKSLIFKADNEYRTFIRRYKGCNNATLFSSTIFTFKFHLISQSFCLSSRHLKGIWNLEAWKVWNRITFIYLLTAFPAIMAACAWELILRNNIDSQSFVSNVCIEVACLSFFEAFLLLILSFMHSKSNSKGY